MKATEIIHTEDGGELLRTYSNTRMLLIQDGTGIPYPEAIDPIDSGRTYTETDIPIEKENTEEFINEELIKE